MATVCLLNSHRWLHERLTEGLGPTTDITLTADPGAADVVIYPVPPWRDPDAPQRLRALRPDVWERLFVFSQADLPVLWAPGVYTSVPDRHAHVASVRGGFYVSHANYEPEHAEALEPRPHDAATFLWTFVGSVSTHPVVRGALVALPDERAYAMDTALWRRDQRWHLEGSGRAERARSLVNYAESLHTAKFVVCPRGVGLSSVRLFEAMRVGRCPVVVSDDWLPPPFVDWDACAVRIPERSLGQLPSILREREHDAAALGTRARAEWEAHFAPSVMLSTLVNGCSDIDASQRGRLSRLRMLGRAAVQRETGQSIKVNVSRLARF